MATKRASSPKIHKKLAPIKPTPNVIKPKSMNDARTFLQNKKLVNIAVKIDEGSETPTQLESIAKLAHLPSKTLSFYLRHLQGMFETPKAFQQWITSVSQETNKKTNVSDVVGKSDVTKTDRKAEKNVTPLTEVGLLSTKKVDINTKKKAERNVTPLTEVGLLSTKTVDVNTKIPTLTKTDDNKSNIPQSLDDEESEEPVLMVYVDKHVFGLTLTSLQREPRSLFMITYQNTIRQVTNTQLSLAATINDRKKSDSTPTITDSILQHKSQEDDIKVKLVFPKRDSDLFVAIREITMYMQTGESTPMMKKNFLIPHFQEALQYLGVEHLELKLNKTSSLKHQIQQLDEMPWYHQQGDPNWNWKNEKCPESEPVL